MRTLELRAAIEKQVDFDFHVRKMGDGWFWVSPDRPLKTHFQELQRVLHKLGFRFEAQGKPGTAGQDILDVYP